MSLGIHNNNDEVGVFVRCTYAYCSVFDIYVVFEFGEWRMSTVHISKHFRQITDQEMRTNHEIIINGKMLVF